MIRFPPKKILVPFDMTEASMRAWGEAKVFTKKFGSALEAAYIEDLLPSSVFVSDPKRLGAALKREIERHLRRRIGDGPKVHMRKGDPVPNILDLIKGNRPDLVIMGTHGRKGLERLRFGSVTEAVVRRSAVPVLSLRGKPRQVRSVLAPINFTDYSDMGLLFAAHVAESFGARLTVLHVSNDPNRCVEPELRIRGIINRLPERIRKATRPRAKVLCGSPTEEILRAASKGEDLVVLAAHHKSLLEELVLGMTAERVLRLSPVPVLTLPPLQKRVEVVLGNEVIKVRV